MKAVILSIGDELALGQTVDTNSAWLSARLVEYGIGTIYHQTLPDKDGPVSDSLLNASLVADMVIVTGGLGPTDDDITRQAVARAMGVGLVMHEPSVEKIRRFFVARGRKMPEKNTVQAMCPEGAVVLENNHGTAPGIKARLGSADVYVMPGIPGEMKKMFAEHVAPAIRDEGGRTILTRSIHTLGEGESMIASMLDGMMDRDANPTVGTTVSRGVVTVRVRSEARNRAKAEVLLEKTCNEVHARLGNLVYGEDDYSIQEAVVKMLLERKLTVCTAESCTGGILGGMFTDVSGSSRCYLGGWVVYSNEMKMSELGVPGNVIEEHGAVSRETADLLAINALRKLSADFAIGITGIAGPEGGTDEKPVGTVWIGIADRKGEEILVDSRRFLFPGTRESIRERTAKTALNLLRLRLVSQNVS